MSGRVGDIPRSPIRGSREAPASAGLGLRLGPATPQGTPSPRPSQTTGPGEGSTGPETDNGVRYTRPDPGRARHGVAQATGTAEGSAVELEIMDEQEELRSSVRSFLEKECPVDVVRPVVETGEAPETVGSMAALDWPALAVPEEFGGIGLTILETAVVVEELGRAIAPGPLLATITQFAPMVREVGTPEQQQRFLSAHASGAIGGTVAMADHPRAWALDDVTMTAEPAEGGWLLTGVKFGVLPAQGMTELAVIAPRR